MTEEMATARKANGDLLYGFGVILNYVFSEKRLEEIADAHMPIHVVEKKIPYMDESGSLVKPDAPNAGAGDGSFGTQRRNPARAAKKNQK